MGEGGFALGDYAVAPAQHGAGQFDMWVWKSESMSITPLGQV